MYIDKLIITMRAIKKLCLVSLVIIVSLASVVSVLNHDVTAKKGDPIYATQSIKSEAEKRLKLNTLAACLVGMYATDIDQNDLTPDDGHAIFNMDTVATGFLSADNNDTMDCGNYTNKTAKDVLIAAGWKGTSLRSVLCDIGAPVTPNRNQCGSSSSGVLTVDPNALSNKILTDFPISNYLYYYGYQALNSSKECGGYTDMGVLGTDIQEGDKTGDDFTFTLINKADGSGENHVYRLKDKDKKVKPFNGTNGLGELKGFDISCKQIIMSHMNHSGADWVKSYIALLGEKSTGCDTKYKTEAEKNACKNGASHKGDSAYCDKTYPLRGATEEIKKANAACKYGAGTSSTGKGGSSGGGAGSSSSSEDPVVNPLEGTGNGDSEEDQENCKIDYIGWIVCPIVNTLASMSEGARARLINMLTVDAKSILGDTSDGSVYSYWSKIRDYANILFVVFFLFVIYSQMTGYGLDNYGIKRMLPKLIVGVIVVNASFYICGLLVDLSNVVGSSAFNFVSAAAVGDIPAGEWSNSDSGWINKIAGLALVLTVGYFALATVISMLLFVVITAVTTIFLLGVREAIIILCIVLSPLAFVAMIMPNTEGLYKKWWSAFKAALMVYPMVGLVFGASNLAARILGSGLDEKDIIMQSIVALLVFAPLLIVPKLVRNAVEIIGIGGAVAWANKMMNKGRDRMTDKVGKWRENKLTSQFGKHRREKAQLRNAQIRGGTYRGKGGIANFRNWRSAANRRLNAKSGDFGQKRKLVGSMALLEEDKERMKMANAWIADNNMSSDRLAEIATGFTRDKDNNMVPVDLSGISSYQRRAAMQALAPHMTGEQAADLAIASASFGDTSLQKEAANAIVQSGAKKAPWVGGKQLEAIRQGTYNEQAAMSDYIENKVSGEGLANAGAEEIRKMRTFAQGAQNNGNNSYMESLSRARADLEADAKRAGGLQTAVRREINDIPLPQGGGNQGGNGGNQGNRNNQGGGGGGRKQGGDPRSGGGGNDQNDQGDRDQGGDDQGGNDQGGDDSNQGDGN